MYGSMRCLLVALTVIVFGAGPSRAAQARCPPPTQDTPAGCVLDGDVVLSETLELPLPVTLNCRGHRILPTAPGSGTTPETYLPSIPPIAVAITASRGVTLHDCVIGDDVRRFDFGVVLMNSKNAGGHGHRVRRNEIHARDAAVTLLYVDDAHISDNTITWTNGYGIALRRDADRNRIANNHLSSPGAPAAPVRLVPDGPFYSPADDGIYLGALTLMPLFNVVVGGRLHQFTNFEHGQYLRNEENVAQANRVSLPGSSVGKSHAGIFVAGMALGERVTGNLVLGAGVGIRIAGLMPNQVIQRPSRCVAATGQEVARYCVTDADCFVPSVDTGPVGTCPALRTEVIDARATGTVVKGNLLIGPFNSTVPLWRAGICCGQGTVGAVLRGNWIAGTGTEAGISVGTNVLESGEVTGNVIYGAAVGLQLLQGNAAHFGARISGNDITDSVERAVGVLGAYTLPTELSWRGAGNYWGHEAPPCFRISDSPLPDLITDSNASCEPLATGD